MSDETCATCNRSHGVDGYNPMHPFRSKTEPGFMRKPEPEIEPVTSAFPFDPILRQALIDKGVLTIDDLRNAEAKILITTGQFHESVREAMRDGGTTAPTSGA